MDNTDSQSAKPKPPKVVKPLHYCKRCLTERRMAHRTVGFLLTPAHITHICYSIILGRHTLEAIIPLCGTILFTVFHLTQPPSKEHDEEVMEDDLAPD